MTRKRKGAPKAGQALSQRQLRVGEELRHVLAEVLARGELRDPDLAGTAITVTEVRVSPDFGNATVYVLPFGGGDAETVVRALGHAQGFLRTELARRVNLRRTPALRFAIDGSFDEARHVDEVLHRPRVRRDLEPETVAPAAPDSE